jgi:3-phenylpropionate/cinnamic acid dioxygenase small subunit
VHRLGWLVKKNCHNTEQRSSLAAIFLLYTIEKMRLEQRIMRCENIMTTLYLAKNGKLVSVKRTRLSNEDQLQAWIAVFLDSADFHCGPGDRAGCWNGDSRLHGFGSSSGCETCANCGASCSNPRSARERWAGWQPKAAAP